MAILLTEDSPLKVRECSGPVPRGKRPWIRRQLQDCRDSVSHETPAATFRRRIVQPSGINRSAVAAFAPSKVAAIMPAICTDPRNRTGPGAE